MMPLKKLVKEEIEDENSSSSSYNNSSLSSTCLLDLQTPSIHTSNTCCLNPNPPYHHLFTRFFDRKLRHSSSAHAHSRTWDRLKALCFASLPTIDVGASSELKKNRLQRREELEREVCVLHEMLDHEEKVHEYLERIHNRLDGYDASIPNFLPPKMKEILVELAMIENEITRLESQIKYLKSETRHENEAKIERKYKEWGREALQNHHHHHHQPPPHPNSRRPNEKASFEANALNFINNAIKGDYHLTSFTIDKSMASKGFIVHVENTRHEEKWAYREKLSRRSSLIKAASPLREPRDPTPRRDQSLEVPSEYSSKVSSTPFHIGEDNIHKWSPNKLSENIMKCLVFIYVRLLRTSRVMEMEKSGPVARSTSFSMSFRAEPNSNSNSKTNLMLLKNPNSNSKTNLMLHKNPRQQDPYGIFDSEASLPRDIGPYKNLVRFTSNSMDLKCIQNSNSVPLFQTLKLLRDGLRKVDLRFLSHQQKLAFWINMYNACIMHGYLQYGVPSVLNHDTLLELINKATLNIAGNTINARQIEHFILRNTEDSPLEEILGKQEKDSDKMIAGDPHGLESADPNIIFALCCGTRSSPAVKIYTADGVAAELERSKLEYLQAAIMVTSDNKIALPQLLLTNMKDFGADKESSLTKWVCRQLPASASLTKSVVDCFRGSAVVVEKMAYEYEFRYLLAV